MENIILPRREVPALAWALVATNPQLEHYRSKLAFEIDAWDLQLRRRLAKRSS
jgi:hypothetical protein